eukprot:5812620-Ditylum_brightwellii.AAC.1
MDGDPINGQLLPGNSSSSHKDSPLDLENKDPPPCCECNDLESSDEDEWPFPAAPPPRQPPIDLVSLGLSNIPNEMGIEQHCKQLQGMCHKSLVLRLFYPSYKR